MNEFVTVPPTVNNSDLLTRIDKPLYEEDKKKKSAKKQHQKE